MTAPGIERRVLFVCTHNAGRSIAAAAPLNAHHPPGVRADSAGTDPTHVLNPTVVAALAERGISLAGVDPKPITTELLTTADLVITMSRHAAGPTLPPGAARQQHWRLDFPGDDDLEAMRSFCDEVDQQVQALLASLQPPTPSHRQRAPAARASWPSRVGWAPSRPGAPTPRPRSQMAA